MTVVLDDCSDGTASAVASYRDVNVVVSTAHQVGLARRQGADQALAHAVLLGFAPSQVWLANTDADSVVGRAWLTRMLDFANTGADLTVGTVLPGPGLSTAARGAWFAAHRLEENHDHVHGANLGIHAEVYNALGGWAAVVSGEDADLVARASAAKYMIRRTASLPVFTSTREVARAPHGFSSFLRNLQSPSSLTAAARSPACSAASARVPLLP